MKHSPQALRLLLMTSLVLSLTASAATAGGPTSRPNWKGSGAGTTRPEDGVHVDDFSGRSSHIGPYVADGFHVLNPVDFTFVGEATWTAANGDTLELVYTGQVFLTGDPDYPFGFEAVLVAVGGTGRLADARGRAVMTGAFTGVPGEFYFDFEGTLHPRGK